MKQPPRTYPREIIHSRMNKLRCGSLIANTQKVVASGDATAIAAHCENVTAALHSLTDLVGFYTTNGEYIQQDGTAVK